MKPLFIWFITLMPVITLAGQVTYLKDDITWIKSGYDYPEILGPGNMKSPDNYYEGNWYCRYELKEKPSNKEVGVQLCVWQNGYKREACASRKTIIEPKVYYWEIKPPSRWWEKPDAAPDW